MAQYDELIDSTAKRFGLPVELFRKQIGTESAGNAQAVSPKGAIGLAQVMPATAKEMGYTAMDMLDPAKSLEAGARYMRKMLGTVKKMNPSLSGDSLHKAALAAYNAGAGGAADYIRTGDESTLSAETRGYLSKITGGATGKTTASRMPGRNLLAGIDLKALDAQRPGRDLVKEVSLIEKAAALADKGFEKLTGGLEAIATLGTGATTGAIAYGTGALEGIAKSAMEGKFGTQEGVKMAEETAAKRAEQYTFQPRTEEGRRQVEAVANVANALTPLTPVAGELAAVSQMAAPAVAASAGQAATRAQEIAAPAVQRAQQAAVTAAQGAKQIARPVAEAAKGAASSVAGVPRRSADLFREMLTGQPTAAKATASEAPALAGATGGGAEAVTAAAQKQARAATLPVPIEFTEAQLASGPGALEMKQWEQTALHTAGEAGDILREHASAQRLNAAQNIERFLDETGATESTPRGIGVAFDKVLQGRYKADKGKVDALYRQAREKGETVQPVELPSLAEALNAETNMYGIANVYPAVRSEAIRVGALAEGPNGALVARPIALNDAETLRQFINNATNVERPNLRASAIMRSAIDEDTQTAGGQFYQAARRARANLGRDFEDRSLVKRLLNTKPNSDDRYIAYEDVLDNVVLSEATSLDSMRHVRRLMLTSGEEGKQAWREVQGGTVRWLGDQLVSPTQRDANGAPVLTPARFAKQVARLDQSGKLEKLFGKQGAQQMRTLAEAVVDLIPAQGTVNTSGTAYTLKGIVADMAANTLIMGVPAPSLTLIKMLRANLRQARDISKARSSIAAGKLSK